MYPCVPQIHACINLFQLINFQKITRFPGIQTESRLTFDDRRFAQIGNDNKTRFYINQKDA